MKSHAQKCAEGSNKKESSSAQSDHPESDQLTGTNTKNGPPKAKADEEPTVDMKEPKRDNFTKQPSNKDKETEQPIEDNTNIKEPTKDKGIKQ